MKKFLIIQTAYIGDVILATPVISELNRIYPNAKIDVLVRKGNETILANNFKINSIHTFNKKEGKFKSILNLVNTFRKEKYDEIINLHRYGSSGLIVILSGAKKTIGFDKNPFSMFYSKKIKHEIGKGKHEVERNLQTIFHHGANSKIRPEIFPSEDDFDIISKYSEKEYVCLAPASVWFTKQLPEKKWVELAINLSTNSNIFLVGGKDDFDFCESIRKKTNLKVYNLAGKLSLLQAAALFKSANMNYVNDSGPLHLCSAVNAPVTSFFCSTTPDFGFGPLSENSKIIESNEPLACKPCGLHGYKKCPKDHFKCGETIDLITVTS